jgi:hypothetical protein
MEIIEVLGGQVPVQLSSIEIHALLKAFDNVRNAYPEDATGYLEISPTGADQLTLKLREALALANRQRQP